MNKGLRDTPTSMPNNQNYRDGWELIYGNKGEYKDKTLDKQTPEEQWKDQLNRVRK